MYFKTIPLILFCIINFSNLCNPAIESEELKLLLHNNKSRFLDQWGPPGTSSETMIYFFLDDRSWGKSLQWFRQNSEAILRIESSSINIIYYPRKNRFLKIDAQRKYTAKVKSREIKNAMEDFLDGTQTTQLRSTPTKVVLDFNRKISQKLGAPPQKLSALVWQRSTNQFRSFHYLEENSEIFFRSIPKIIKRD